MCCFIQESPTWGVSEWISWCTKRHHSVGAILHPWRSPLPACTCVLLSPCPTMYDVLECHSSSREHSEGEIPNCRRCWNKESLCNSSKARLKSKNNCTPPHTRYGCRSQNLVCTVRCCDCMSWRTAVQCLVTRTMASRADRSWIYASCGSGTNSASTSLWSAWQRSPIILFPIGSCSESGLRNFGWEQGLFGFGIKANHDDFQAKGT